MALLDNLITGLKGSASEAILASKQTAQELAQQAGKPLEQAIDALSTQAKKQAPKLLSEQASDSLEGQDNTPKDQIDFSAYLIHKKPDLHTQESSATTQPSEGESQKTPRAFTTGIKKLDQKIAERNLSPLDYLVARKYLGIDLNMTLNGNLNIKNDTKFSNRTQASTKIHDTLSALEQGDDLIKKAQKNSGIINGAKRALNRVTLGIFGLNKELAETDNAQETYKYSLARILTQGGQTTESARKDAERMSAFGARSAEEITSRYNNNQRRLLTILNNQIANLEALGGQLPKETQMRILGLRDKAQYIEKNNGKALNLKEYNKAGNKYGNYLFQYKASQ